jgi:hypothetical protein
MTNETTNVENPYKVQVIADNSGKWCGNGCTFPTIDAAKEYGRDLFWRWTAVRNWRVVSIDETTVHYTYE